MEAFDSYLLDRPVHTFHWVIGPKMIGFCQKMFDLVGSAGQAEAYLT